MCGIAGWFRLAVETGERLPLLRAMCDTLVHRGPDDEGTFVGEDVALGMRRLSIVDLAGGHQPMASEDGRVQLVFNGEIYNHDALREALAARGHRFRTRCDTEVVLRQYEDGGLDALAALNGMFAIALWDGRAGALHLLRDRLGIKPLYWAWDGGALVFGSEPKAILASGRVRREVDPLAIWDYLTLRYVPGPHSIWRSMWKLPPGHRLTLRRGDAEPRIERWWDVPLEPPREGVSEQELDREFAALFTDAVRLRMIADVPVGVLLSGGLDSSAVAAAVARAPGARLSTFCVAFREGGEWDEREYAREVAKWLGTDHQEIVIGAREFTDFLPRYVEYADEPLADLASIPLYYVSRLAREHVKVVLSGEGSDEILGGYDFDRVVAGWEEALRAVRPLDFLGEGAWAVRLRRLVPGARRRESEVLAALDASAAAVPSHITHYLDSDEKRALLGPGAAHRDSLDVVREPLARAAAAEPLQRMLYAWCQSWLAEDLLAKADRMSMATSLELRVPFLDVRLVEWAARAPRAMKVGRDGAGPLVTKRALRRFARGLLPPRILERRKRGFPVPAYAWLSGPLRDFAHDAIAAPGAKLRGRMDGVALDAALSAGTGPEASVVERHRLWNLLVLELWLRRWEVA